jgi:predicted dehydrogenase
MTPARRAAKGGPIGVGIVGFGYMGRTHLAAYRAAAAAGFANRVVALCDRELARLGGGASSPGNLEPEWASPLDLGGVALHQDARALLADARISLVSLCTPTDTHVPLALAALAAGKHVLLEKPVALRARDVARLAVATRKARRVCMPAMCMRFWPGWSWLKEAIAARRYGRVLSAVFRRLAAPPSWAREFYGNARKSGGALFDLHVHDADFVRHALGPPASVFTSGSLDHVTTVYRYARGPAHVVAEGGWDHSDGFPFFMGYTVVFERATAQFALGREPLLTLARGGQSEPIELPRDTGYDGEVRHLLAVLAGKTRLRSTLDEAVGLVRMLEAERRSLETGRSVRCSAP